MRNSKYTIFEYTYLYYKIFSAVVCKALHRYISFFGFSLERHIVYAMMNLFRNTTANILASFRVKNTNLKQQSRFESIHQACDTPSFATEHLIDILNRSKLKRHCDIQKT